jgi:transposase
MLRQKLSADQRHELEDLVKTTRDVKLYRRAKVMLYKEGGYSAEEIEVHTDYSEREQWWWLARYRQEGVKGLSDRPRCGCPRQEHPAKSASREPAKSPTLEEWPRITREQLHAHHPKPYLRERAQMVLWRAKGDSEAAIADILGVQVRTVRQVLANYDRQGLRGLYRQPGSGRPAKLAVANWEQVSAWVKQGPRALGYRFVKWTTRSLRACIDKKWKVRLSRERIRQQLHRFGGYTWTRGKKVPAPRDPAKWQRERQAFCQRMLVSLGRIS